MLELKKEQKYKTAKEVIEKFEASKLLPIVTLGTTDMENIIKIEECPEIHDKVLITFLSGSKHAFFISSISSIKTASVKSLEVAVIDLKKRLLRLKTEKEDTKGLLKKIKTDLVQTIKPKRHLN